jgi:L-rhamnose mutarotase
VTRRLCLALDLVDDAALIAEYERWHRPGHTPGAVLASIHGSDIRQMEIYRTGNRMFMLIEADDDFSETAKAEADADNPHVQAWAALMKPFQQPVPAAGRDGTWIEATCIFRLSDHLS